GGHTEDFGDSGGQTGALGVDSVEAAEDDAEVVLVVEIDVDSEGYEVVLLRFGPLALVFGDSSQLVIGAGLAMAVVELHLDSEGFAVVLLGFGPLALL